MIEIKSLKFEKTRKFSKIFLKYINSKTPTLNSINLKTKNYFFDNEKREIIQNIIKNQYKNFEISSEVQKNIKLLNDKNTYTVTTGHQLNIFTGPLYVIYKIITTINLAERLNKTYKNKYFIPIYWMASEDHDFDEIKSFSLFGKNYDWDIKSSGAVGNLEPRGIKKILDKLPEKLPLFERAYLKQTPLSSSVLDYMNELFGKYGLIVLDPNHKKLKKMFTGIIQDDIINNSIKKLNSDSSKKPLVNVRKINFFYMKKNLRERIIKEENKYKINNTSLTFSEKEIIKEIKTNPQSFSPNVIMRCLYQQLILPNLVYVGGPSEVEYWLEFEKFFKHYDILFPIIVPRNFALIIQNKIQTKLKQLNIQFDDLFKEKPELERLILKNQSNKTFELKKERIKIEKEMDNILKKSEIIEKSISGKILALRKKIINEINAIEKKMIKEEKKNHQKSLDKLNKIYSKLFPDKVLQERKENFLNYHLSDKNFIQNLVNNFDPLKFYFNIISKQQ